MIRKNKDRNIPVGKLTRILDDLPLSKELIRPLKSTTKGWYYRVFKVVDGKEAYFCIKEFYLRLGAAVGSKPKSGSAWTENPCHPFGESKSELMRDLKNMFNDAKRYPVKVERLRSKQRIPHAGRSPAGKH